MNGNKERYGLFTAITMIVGICIGSGIFFKSDNILSATGGSISLGVLVFALAAIGIIFGGLCIGELASKTDKPGGVITYFEEFGGKPLACGFGWFQIFIYYPTISAVVSWVVGIYIDVLFNLNLTFGKQVLIGFAFMTISFVYNVLSPKFGGYFQNATTVIKLIPLFILAIFGLIFGDPIGGFSAMSSSEIKGVGWISAVGPIAFMFDGWIVSTSIAHEIKKSKRNLPLALIISPIFVLLAYVIYFVGVSSYLGPQKLMELQDAHVDLIASQIFGSFGAKVILTFVVISVMGTVNGLVLGFIRLPQALALRGNMMPFSKKLSEENKKLNMPLNSAIFAYILSAFWMLVHYITFSNKLLPNSDVSEISIAVSYLLYIVLYIIVIILFAKGKIKGLWKGVIVPTFAVIGALFILSGGLQSAMFVYYFLFCLLIVI
ncbi:MAG: amino acid permease, partial [Oscillospiraceae bacterium]|nr:amino acid permease [Oscillospiraceae bacterium]